MISPFGPLFPQKQRTRVFAPPFRHETAFLAIWNPNETNRVSGAFFGSFGAPGQVGRSYMCTAAGHMQAHSISTYMHIRSRGSGTHAYEPTASLTAHALFLFALPDLHMFFVCLTKFGCMRSSLHRCIAVRYTLCVYTCLLYMWRSD